MKDYSDFFTHVVANHLHKLVDLVEFSRRKKILVHEWILGIEYNWPEYIHVSDDNSEFIPRLSFWIGGLRDRFNSDPKKSEVVEMLDKTFDASTFCFFEYGARDDVLKQIEKYSKEVDEFFGEDILTHKFKKFKLSQKIVKIVNNAFEKLVDFGVKQDKIDSIRISKDIDTASDLEKEFNKLIETIIKLSINSTTSPKNEVINYLEEFLGECQELGYDKSVLYIKITNIFRMAIKNIDVSLRIGKKLIKNKTDDKGEIVFIEIPKGNVTLSFNHKKEREYTLEINKAFNKKNIWLFSF
jgi:hypothetical protein